MSKSPSLRELVARLRAFRDARDWARFHTPKNLATSVAIEAAELLEVFQWTDDSQLVTPEASANAADEAADVLIYLLLLCDRLDIDLATATATKIERNEMRFPVQSAVQEQADG